jgi:DNA polymerase elongation subunit (family B)
MRILHLDIETSPNQVYCWGLFKQNIGLNQIVNSGTTLCWSAKWHGEDKIMYSSIYHESRHRMLKRIHHLLDTADAVVHYNGEKFDIPTLNKEFVLSKMTPPSTYRQIDLYKTVRSQFRFTSNKLDYVAQRLGLGGKTQHKGMELWTECMAFKDSAWNTMRTYNKQDVVLTEKLYNRLLPWIKNHPNVALYTDGTKVVCRTCPSVNIHKRGYQYTNGSKFQRYRCMDCGSWMRSRTNLHDREHLLLTA